MAMGLNVNAIMFDKEGQACSIGEVPFEATNNQLPYVPSAGDTRMVYLSVGCKQVRGEGIGCLQRPGAGRLYNMKLTYFSAFTNTSLTPPSQFFPGLQFYSQGYDGYLGVRKVRIPSSANNIAMRERGRETDRQATCICMHAEVAAELLELS